MKTINRINAWQAPYRLKEHRYRLGFEVNPKGNGRMLIIGLNPSTASLTTTDPTVDSFCRGIANHMGFREMEIINLFSYRSTDKKGLLKFPKPVGNRNDLHMKQAICEAELILAAWGAYFHPIIKERADKVHNLLTQYARSSIMILGRNKDGSPKHPLYQKINSSLQKY